MQTKRPAKDVIVIAIAWLIAAALFYIVIAKLKIFIYK